MDDDLAIYLSVWEQSIIETRCEQAILFLCIQGNVWAGAIGASLQYGTIQAKMFRVYTIFRRPGEKNIVSS